MKNIKLLKAWGPHMPGERVVVEDKVATVLVGKGIAFDATAPVPESEASPVSAKLKAVKKKAKRKHPLRRKVL